MNVLEEGAALLCICTQGALVKWPLPFAPHPLPNPTRTHTHTHTHTHSAAAGPLRAEPRSHSLQRGREKRRDRGSERVREGVRLKVCE